MKGVSSLKIVLLLCGVMALVVVAMVLYLFLVPQKAVAPTELQTGPDVSAEISGAVETPAEKLPETNPFSGYKNPFE